MVKGSQRVSTQQSILYICTEYNRIAGSTEVGETFFAGKHLFFVSSLHIHLGIAQVFDIRFSPKIFSLYKNPLIPKHTSE
jgi:hypothetical protein